MMVKVNIFWFSKVENIVYDQVIFMLKYQKLNLNICMQFKCIIFYKCCGNKVRIIEKIGRNIIFDLLGYILM